MAKVKFTKNELKKQKDQLKRFKRYLPTLQLKKQQLQIEIRNVEAKQEEVRQAQEMAKKELEVWIGVFGEDLPLGEYVKVESIKRGEGNIAGVDIPTFMGVDYQAISYNPMLLSAWVDLGIEALQKIVAYDLEIAVLNEQIALLAAELRTTTQRVNLFEKVKIPETKDNIRQINIYLGDQQTAAVVRGKIAKGKVVVQGASA
jgi:V/A-type H+-transporting ATPase subunit D